MKNNILAISASLKSASIAMRLDKNIYEENILLDSSAFLVENIQKFLKNHQISWNDLNGVIAASGPGSFTGIRIGISIIKSIKEFAKIPVRVASYFEVLDSLFICGAKSKSKLIFINGENDGEFYCKITRNTVEDNAACERIDESQVFNNFYDTVVGEDNIEIFDKLRCNKVYICHDLKLARHLLTLNYDFDLNTSNNLSPFYIKQPFIIVKK